MLGKKGAVAMYSSFRLALKYIRYYITASNGKGHGIHSPFVYHFVRHVFQDVSLLPDCKKLEAYRKELLLDETMLTVDDFGAGSVTGLKKERKIRHLAASSLKSRKYAQLLYRLVQVYQPSHLLELGTSLGLTTAYLALANPSLRITTLEGSPAIAQKAQQTFDRFSLSQIQVVEGNFDIILNPVIQQIMQLDWVYIDGNHRKEPTLNYFEQLLKNATPQSVFIFDDIHWSAEMEAAWEQIKAHEAVRLTIDLFFIGIVFFRSEQKQKEHFTIRF
jgi:predicted O-methyltransferase YrrM